MIHHHSGGESHLDLLLAKRIVGERQTKREGASLQGGV